MKCTKCDGVMIFQTFFDHFLNFNAWKCINCGKMVVKKEKTLEFDVLRVFYQQHKCKKQQ